MFRTAIEMASGYREPAHRTAAGADVGQRPDPLPGAIPERRAARPGS